MNLSSSNDVGLQALFWPFVSDVLAGPESPLLFLGARPGAWQAQADEAWICEQSFRPFAAVLEQHGLAVVERVATSDFATSLVLPPRSRDAARAMLARAVHATRDGGRIVAAAANDEGGRSLEADLRRLLSNTGNLSKFKCRIALATRSDTALDNVLLREWLALGDVCLRHGPSGEFWTRPGLFAWDRVDPASALLAEHLPVNLSGRVADLGAGWGFLSMQIATRCAAVTSLDLFEAQADALEPARRNLQKLSGVRPDLEVRVHWHDVTTGLPGQFDVVVSNPPFHVGRADQPELGRAFIARAAQALTERGEFWLVANRHLPYEATLSERFRQVRTVAERGSFKVIHANEPIQ